MADTVKIPVFCEDLCETHWVRTPAETTVSQFEGLIWKQHSSKLTAGVTPAQIQVFGPDGRRYSGHRMLPYHPEQRLTYRIDKGRPLEQYEAFQNRSVGHEFEDLKEGISSVFATQYFEVEDGSTAPEGRDSLNALMSLGASLPNKEEAEEEEEAETEEAEDGSKQEDEEEAEEDEAEEESKEEEEEEEEAKGEDRGEDEGEPRSATRRISLQHSISGEVHALRIPHDATVVDVERQVFEEILQEREGMEAVQVILLTAGRRPEFLHPFTPLVGDAFVYHILDLDGWGFLREWDALGDELASMEESEAHNLEILHGLMRTLSIDLWRVSGFTPAWRELMLTMQAFLAASKKRITEEGEKMSAKSARKKGPKIGSRLLKTLDNILKAASRRKEHLEPGGVADLLRADYYDIFYCNIRKEKDIDKELWREFFGEVMGSGKA